MNHLSLFILYWLFFLFVILRLMSVASLTTSESVCERDLATERSPAKEEQCVILCSVMSFTAALVSLTKWQRSKLDR